MRREWIDEGKPRDRDEERRWEAVKAHDAKLQSNGDSNEEPRIRESSVSNPKAVHSGISMSGGLNNEPQGENLFVSDNDDMEDSTSQNPKPNPGTTQPGPVAQNASKITTQTDDSLLFSDDEAPKALGVEDPDDLDALLAEDEQRQKESSKVSFTGPSKTKDRVPDEFDDEMEAMAGYDDW